MGHFKVDLSKSTWCHDKTLVWKNKIQQCPSATDCTANWNYQKCVDTL